MIAIPKHWEHKGLILSRDADSVGGVVGDPCIVWDDDIHSWRMVLFVEKPGVGQAICTDPSQIGVGGWKYLGPLAFTNPEALSGGRTHKPYIIQDAHRPNRAAKIDGRYWLVTVSYSANGHGHYKMVQRAHATTLAGPWTLEDRPLIDVGSHDAFDAKHVDAVSGFYFPEREEIVYFYMGYPYVAQPYAISPLGSAQGVAVQKAGDLAVRKLGVVLAPSDIPGHWASGYVGGMQILSGKDHRWIAIVNASPTPPTLDKEHIWHEEPPPSLGGFAYCDEAFPVSNWHWCPDPIEWIADLPKSALENGEGVNLWRHHLLVTADNRVAVYYNSGQYAHEQLYLKVGV